MQGHFFVGLSLRRFLTQHGNLARVAGGIVRRLEDEGQALEGRMADDAHECIEANLALADAGVTVLVAAQAVLAVVEVDGLEARKADG